MIENIHNSKSSSKLKKKTFSDYKTRSWRHKDIFALEVLFMFIKTGNVPMELFTKTVRYGIIT